MSLRISLLAGLSAMLLALSAAPLAAQQVYRWTDDKGVVHYSDKRPEEGVDFERRAVVVDPARDPADEDGDDAETTEATKRQQAQASCQQARQSLAVLTSAADVSMDMDGDGVPEPLDAAGRQSAIARYQDLVDAYCET